MRVAAAVRVGALAMGVAGLAIGCSDVVGPTAPDAPRPSLTLTGSVTGSVTETVFDTVTVVRRLIPVWRDVTVGAWINRAGGTLTIPGAGLKVIIPTGAVQKRTYITATAHAGYLVSYEFGPHGTTFNVPVQMQQDARYLNIWRLDGELKPEVIPIEAAYYPERSAINKDNGTAAISEILPVNIDLLGSKIHFDVHHFSGYLLASGRK